MLSQSLHTLKVNLIFGLTGQHQRDQSVVSSYFGGDGLVIFELITAHGIDWGWHHLSHLANVVQYLAPIVRFPFCLFYRSFRFQRRFIFDFDSSALFAWGLRHKGSQITLGWGSFSGEACWGRSRSIRT